jgi:hypothetical protein
VVILLAAHRMAALARALLPDVAAVRLEHVRAAIARVALEMLHALGWRCVLLQLHSEIRSLQTAVATQAVDQLILTRWAATGAARLRVHSQAVGAFLLPPRMVSQVDRRPLGGILVTPRFFQGIGQGSIRTPCRPRRD